MKSRCIIHIGAPKTGSTALQKYMADNRELLLDRGVLYCATGLRGFGHHDVAFLLGGGYPVWATPQEVPLPEMVPGFGREAEHHHGDVFLSSENFFIYPNPSGLRGFLEETGLCRDRKIRILAWVRRQDEAHESWYNQTIKAQGYTHGWEECVAAFHGLWDYAAMLAPWAGEFGEEAVMVRPYEAVPPGRFSIISDGLETLGLDPASMPPEPGRVNTGINRDALEFQRIMNGLAGTPEEKRRFHKQLIALSRKERGTGAFDETPSIPAHRRRRILEEYAASNALVARTYLGREELFQKLDVEEATEPDPYQGLTVERYAQILDWIASCMK